MRKMLRIIGIGLLIVFIGIQFIRPNQTNPPVDPKTDFLTLTQPPAEIATMIRTTCYDCHSHETKYPWYANVAPVSWILQDHIMEGRESLNFSKWGTPQAFKAEEGEEGEGSGEALEEIVEVIQEGEMPLWDYKLIHADARLNEGQKTQLIAWFQNLPGGGAAINAPGKEQEEAEENE